MERERKVNNLKFILCQKEKPIKVIRHYCPIEMFYLNVAQTQNPHFYEAKGHEKQNSELKKNLIGH